MKKRAISGLLLLILLLSVFPLDGLAASRTFKINSITMNSRGHMVVKWKDTELNPPYTVYYRCTNGSVKQHSFYINNISTTSCSIPSMCPGVKYMVTVEDSDGDTCSKEITVPRRDDYDFRRGHKAYFEFRYKTSRYMADSKAKALKNLSASAIERNTENGYLYGFWFRIRYTALGAKTTKHDVVFAISAPNGYVYTEYDDDFMMPRLKRTYTYNFVGGNFFKFMYDDLGYIPAGQYTFRVFMEGRLLIQRWFDVD